MAPRPSRPWSLALRAGALLALALGLAYSAAQLALRRPAVRAELRRRVAAALEARLGPVELGPELRVDPLFRVRFGPLAVPGARPGDPPLVRVESARVRADLAALLHGRARPASVRLDGVRVALPDRPDALRQLAARLRRPHPAAAPAAGGEGDGPVVRVRDLTVSFTVGDHDLRLGPLQATVRRAPGPEGGGAAAEVRFPGGGQARLDVRGGAAGWRAEGRLERLDRGALPAGLERAAALWAGGTVGGSLTAEADPALARASARVELAARGLLLGGAMIGPQPVGPLDLGLAGVLAWDGARRRARLEQGRLTLPGGGAVAIEAELGLTRELPLTLSARADGLDYLRTVTALPPALALPAEAPHPAGTLDAHVAFTGPLLRPRAWAVDADLDLSRLRQAARTAPPPAVAGPFVHEAEVDDGPPHRFLVGPANRDFVPLSELPRHVVRAVTASEDAGFFGHSGFDFAELRNAAVEGAQAGHVVRGGSTISQQLAKNLYLTREKTLARKLREAIATVALEATLPKHRLMEIYLNVAEWGPGLWGIGPAARHWFGKDARALTPREAAFLATVIPNPVRYHYMWTRGALSLAWQQRVDDLLRTMYGQGALTDEEYAAAMGQSLRFANPAAGGPAEVRGAPAEPDPPDDEAGEEGETTGAAGARIPPPASQGRRGRTLRARGERTLFPTPGGSTAAAARAAWPERTRRYLSR